MLTFIICLPFFVVAMIFAIEHANVVSISEKPLNTHDRDTAEKYFYIAAVCLLFCLICGLVDVTFISRISLAEYFSKPAPVLMAMFITDAWLLSYIDPSDRKMEVIRRKNFRNASH